MNEEQIENNRKESYWNILSNYHKELTLNYYATIKEVPESDWQYYACIGYFQREKIDPFKLPDWIFKAKPHQLRAMADTYQDPFVKKALENAREKGIL